MPYLAVFLQVFQRTKYGPVSGGIPHLEKCRNSNAVLTLACRFDKLWMQQSRIHFAYRLHITEVTVHTTQFTVNAR